MRRESQEQRLVRRPVRLRHAPGGGTGGSADETSAADGAAIGGPDTLASRADTQDSGASALDGSADTLESGAGSVESGAGSVNAGTAHGGTAHSAAARRPSGATEESRG